MEAFHLNVTQLHSILVEKHSSRYRKAAAIIFPFYKKRLDESSFSKEEKFNMLYSIWKSFSGKEKFIMANDESYEDIFLDLLTKADNDFTLLLKLFKDPMIAKITSHNAASEMWLTRYPITEIYIAVKLKNAATTSGTGTVLNIFLNDLILQAKKRKCKIMEEVYKNMRWSNQLISSVPVLEKE